jgi:UDP-glucose:(heptosyl)LPS alpha-1,3-glucosyltransferase
MKLAFCVANYFPFGGLESHFLRIARFCQQQGHKVSVYTLAWRDAMPKDLQVIVVPVWALQNHARHREFVRKALPLLAKEGFDGVIGFLKMPGLDVYYAADPCFQARIHREKHWFYRLSPRYRTYVEFERAVFDVDATTEILMLTELEIPDYILYYQTPRERFHLLPPGIARNRMASDDVSQIRACFRQYFGFTEDERLVLMIGSDFKRKGLDRALRALAALPPSLRHSTRLLAVGESKVKPFQRLAKHLGIADRVHFLGGRSDVPRFLMGADLLIHPAYTENTGNVLLEAIVAGLPVLTTANCGYSCHVEQAQAGRIIPVPFRQECLNEALVDMLKAPERERWSRNGIAYGRSKDLYSRTEVAFQSIMTLLERPGRR